MPYHPLWDDLDALGYRMLIVYPAGPKAAPLEEIRLVTNGQYVHAVLVYRTGMSQLYLQAGGPFVLGMQSQIDALRALHATQETKEALPDVP